MFAQLKRREGCKSVSVLRHGDDDRIKLFFVIKQLAEVGRSSRLGKEFGCYVDLLRVYIAEGDNVLSLKITRVALTYIAQANHGDVESFVQVMPTQDGGC